MFCGLLDLLVADVSPRPVFMKPWKGTSKVVCSTSGSSLVEGAERSRIHPDKWTLLEHAAAADRRTKDLFVEDHRAQTRFIGASSG